MKVTACRLLLTFLVTSADSGILVMNTIMSGGNQDTGIKHRIIWGVLLTLVIGALLIAGGGGLEALKNAMIIAALPFTMIMVLMVVSLTKALFMDSARERHEVISAEVQTSQDTPDITKPTDPCNINFL